MITTAIKRIAAGLTLGAVFALAACAEETEIVEAPAGVIEGVTIENARLVLAPVAGNPAAVYFDFGYEGERAFSLSRTSVEGAQSAVMHQYGEYDRQIQMMEALPIPVTNGAKIEFKPGDLHVMAFELSPEIEPGDTAEITLTVSGGDTHKFDAEVRAAGDER